MNRPPLSTLTAAMSAEPCVEASLIEKFVGVIGSSNDDERPTDSAPTVPMIRRARPSIHSPLLTGPVAMVRMIGPESPSSSRVNEVKSSDSEPKSLSLSQNHNRPSNISIAEGQPAASLNRLSSQFEVDPFS